MLSAAERYLLVQEFGQQNVEEALIFVVKACDRGGRRVIVEPTAEMVRSILEAVHGRTPVGGVRL